jgi:hypothetical protein
MAQSLAVSGIPSHTDLASRPVMQAAIGRYEFSLNRRLAASVEVALRSEPGVEEAAANPITGRVLLRYSPSHIQAPVETLIRQALALDTITEEELSRPVISRPFLLPKRLLAAELGCSISKLLLFGGISCPVGGIWCAAAVIFTLRLAVQRSVS